MLDALRRSVGGWVAKVFIGLLVLSFAVWGIADIFSGFRGSEVARVGETEIPTEVYRSELQREIQQVSQRIGTYLTLDQARSVGLDGRVLGRLVAEASLDEEARRRGLGMSDAVVAESIRSDPGFRAPGGQFDSAYFEQFLRATGVSEAEFVAQQRRRVLRQSVAEAVGGGAPAPTVIAEAVDRYRNETRAVEYLRLTPEQLEEAPTPTEEELRAYFDENPDQFRTPEYRRVALIELTPEDIAGEIEVTDEDARASFEARANQFSQPERRSIEQIPFPSAEAAAEARAAIDDGSTFEDVAAEQGVAEGDLAIGTLTRDEVVDDQIAEAAFALEAGEVSQPVEGMFSTVLLRVTDIEAGENRSFEDAADQVREQLALDRARGEILDLYDLVEDDRAGGSTLEEIADRRDLPYRTIDAVDRQGRGVDGERIPDLPAGNELVQQVFETDPGVESQALQTGSEGYLWFDVLEITPAGDRTFEEAEADVREAWLSDETRQRVDAFAREVADRVRGGSLDEVAEDLELEIETADSLNRGSTGEPFGQSATSTVFITPEGEIGVAPVENSPDRLVFRVTDITVPAYSPSEDDPVADDIAGGLTDDLLGQYLAQLQNTLGVEVNQEALSQAFGQTNAP